MWPLPYPSRLPRASSDVVPRDNEAGSNEQHCDRHHWTQEQAHILKVGIVQKADGQMKQQSLKKCNFATLQV